MITLPDPREQTIGDVLPLLSSSPWQRELLRRRLADEWWRGLWWGVALALPLAGWGGWLLSALCGGAR